MRLYRKIEKILLNLINFVWRYFIILHEVKNIFRKRKLYKDVKLTKEQKKQIDQFYIANYGKKVPYWWHRLYQSYTGKFDYRYIPEYIFSTRLELRNNKRLDVMPFENKNMLSVLFDGIEQVKVPKTYIMCVKGCYFDSDRNIIKRSEAIQLLQQINGGNYPAVIKATVDTSSGRDVRILNISNGIDSIKNETIDTIFVQMGEDFVVQERLVPHPVFKALYPNAINTLRVVTYMLNDKIAVAPITMRIGQGGGMVDNAHAGGMFIGVTDEGKLLREGFTEYQKRYTVHPDSKIVFEDYQLPCIPEIRKVAIKLHQQVPMLQFVSWDFTVDENSRIVLIEANLHSQTVWFPQMAHGKAFFGEDTGVIFQGIRKSRKANLRGNME